MSPKRAGASTVLICPCLICLLAAVVELVEHEKACMITPKRAALEGSIRDRADSQHVLKLWIMSF